MFDPQPSAGGDREVPVPDLRRREEDGERCPRARPTRSWASTSRSPTASRRAATTSAARRCSPSSTATTVRVRNGKIVDDRRPVRRDQGAARRLLPDRGARPERRDPGRVAHPVGAPSAASRCGRSWTSRASRSAIVTRRRRVRRARRASTRVYRAESRRVLATLIRLLGDFDLAEEALHDAFAAARRAVAARRRARQPARLAGLDRALQGDRRAAPARALRRRRWPSSPSRLDATTRRAATRTTTASRTTGCG